MKIAVLTAGFLPIPATKGGAVENLVVNIINENEKKQIFKFEILSTYDSLALNESKKYNYSSFVFIKTNILAKALDKIVFFVAKNIFRKKKSNSYRYIFKRLSYLRKCSKILKKNDYDYVLLENHPSEYLALKWHKNYIKYKNKYFYHCHNEFQSTYNCKSIIDNTKKIICVSEFRKNNVKEYLGLPDSKFSVLKNGIDTIKFQTVLIDSEKEKLREKYHILKDDKILIYTGRVVPEKGIKEAILATKKINDKKIKLMIVGASLNKLNAKTRFEKEIESLIDDKIIFTGYINYDEIYKYYQLADLAVLPSIIDDSAPLTVIESLVSGLPIISTNSGGIPEYAIDGSAILINRDENMVNNIANSIRFLFKNEKKLDEMSSTAKEVSCKLTKEKYYSDFCNIILESDKNE